MNNTHKPLDKVLEDEGYDNVEDYLLDNMDEVSVPACCVHGCEVELDGECPHGNKSIVLEARLI